jgi:hypothetical protein
MRHGEIKEFTVGEIDVVELLVQQVSGLVSTTIETLVEPDDMFTLEAVLYRELAANLASRAKLAAAIAQRDANSPRRELSTKTLKAKLAEAIARAKEKRAKQPNRELSTKTLRIVGREQTLAAPSSAAATSGGDDD